MSQHNIGILWYQTNLDVYLNRWFANYDAAQRARQREGGYLQPYKHHFFVCHPEVIKAMGLDPDDRDWKRIGWDCVQPLDSQAYARLRAKREQVVRATLARDRRDPGAKK